MPPYIAKNAARNRFLALTAGLVAAALVAVAVVVASPVAFVALGAGALAFARVALRLRVAQLTIGDGEVVLDGPWATQRVALTDVTGFEPGLFNTQPGVFLRRADGRRFFVWTLSVETPDWGVKRRLTQLAPVADQLNAELAARRRGRG